MAIRAASLLEIIPCCFASMMCINSVVWVSWSSLNLTTTLRSSSLCRARSAASTSSCELPRIFPLMTHRDAKSHCQRWPHITKYHKYYFPTALMWVAYTWNTDWRKLLQVVEFGGWSRHGFKAELTTWAFKCPSSLATQLVLAGK